MREIKISLDTATRWANGTDEELKALALQTYPELSKKELPKSWEELGEIKGYWIDSCSETRTQEYYENRAVNKLVFATKEQAEASIALAQLSQLRAVYRNGWVPDWSDDSCRKFCIEFYDEKLYGDYYTTQTQFLSFQDEETRDLFLENFRELIEKAKPLMS